MIVMFAVILIRTAWVGDDAFISFRVVDNLINGFGLRWNIAERVQSFTNPLWVFVIAAVYYFTHEIYFTSLAVSIIVSLLAVGLLVCKGTSNSTVALIIFLLLLASNAFIDYSTSGLENPLLHLLLVAFFLQVRANWAQATHYRTSIFLASLIGLTRLDGLLFTLPLCFALFLRTKQHRWRGALVGALPLIAWELFSLVYYGSLFPNTYYAKIPVNVPKSELFLQGFVYFLDALMHDPITPSVIALGIVYAFFSRSAFLILFALGIAGQLFNILSVGGDYMAGRFLTTSVISACCILTSMNVPTLNRSILYLVSILIICLNENIAFSFSSGEYFVPKAGQVMRPSGLYNERAIYFDVTGLVRFNRRFNFSFHRWANDGRNVRNAGSIVIAYPFIGLYGFFAGPYVHIVDSYALADAFLSHMPVLSGVDWNIGHFEREIPVRYMSSLRMNANYFNDPLMAKYFSDTMVITRGQLFSFERWRLILLRMIGRGSVRGLIQNVPREVLLEDVPNFTMAGAPWNAWGHVVIPPQGVRIVMPRVFHENAFTMAFDCNDKYHIHLFHGRQEVYFQYVDAGFTQACGMRFAQFIIPDEVALDGYDSILIYGEQVADDRYSLGQLSFRNLRPESPDYLWYITAGQSAKLLPK